MGIKMSNITTNYANNNNNNNLLNKNKIVLIELILIAYRDEFFQNTSGNNRLKGNDFRNLKFEIHNIIKDINTKNKELYSKIKTYTIITKEAITYPNENIISLINDIVYLNDNIEIEITDRARELHYKRIKSFSAFQRSLNE